MPDEHRKFYSSPFPPLGFEFVSPAHEKVAMQTASREVSEREAAYIAALNRPSVPTLEMPPIKEPTLPENFQQRVNELDQRIFERGLAVDRDKLLALGKERFAKLIEADRETRSLQRVLFNDLSSWPHVLGAFQFASVRVPMPAQTISEQASGAGADREAVRRLAGFVDLWKFDHPQGEPVTVRNVYAFHDLFSSLVFGQSMLEQIGTDGRLRNHFFCGDGGAKVALFDGWLSVLQQPLASVTISHPVWHVVAWLADETQPQPSLLELARDFFGVRSASRSQIIFAAAVIDGFLLGLEGWLLWEYVGRRTRIAADEKSLATQRGQLVKRYPRIANFHRQIAAAFFSSRAIHGDAHVQFESDRYRTFIDRCMAKLLQTVSGVIALAIDEQLPNTLVVRHRDRWLIETQGKRLFMQSLIESKLGEAFGGATFYVEVSE